ncbi:MAG: aspartate carbamoyltransferase regulatory subunit [Paludibacteraceae bacterium]|jgi:aspartate carbamoyltransferase regulatory subunit|nr:aspartate carbamoyltransferase regulatory subunit [Paludibacteraceae bacterium]
MKHLQVAALSNGTVIDHIPANKLFKVFSLLNLENCKETITVGNNLNSETVGKKGIIKISERIFSEDETNKIALIAPKAKINIIQNYEVIEKRLLSLPDEVREIVQCLNPACITNHQPVHTWFHVTTEENETRLKCHYCEREVKLEEIKLAP